MEETKGVLTSMIPTVFCRRPVKTRPPRSSRPRRSIDEREGRLLENPQEPGPDCLEELLQQLVNCSV